MKQLLRSRPDADSLQNKIFFLNTSDFISKDDRYILDDHFNKNGHEKIAREIKKIMDANPALPN